MLTTKQIEKELKDHRKSLKEYEHYRDSIAPDSKEPIATLIEDCDFESDDFNIGFEQGYIRGMENLLSLSKD
jgi:hypothetical protein